MYISMVHGNDMDIQKNVYLQRYDNGVVLLDCETLKYHLPMMKIKKHMNFGLTLVIIVNGILYIHYYHKIWLWMLKIMLYTIYLITIKCYPLGDMTLI